MRVLIIRFIQYILFWLIFFLVAKGLFVLFNINHASQVGFVEIVHAFLYGFRMDLSAAAYLTLLPGVWMSMAFLLPSRLWEGGLRVYTYVFLAVASVLCVADLGLYPHWGTRIGIEAFYFLGNLQAVWASVTWRELIQSVVLIAVISSVFVYIYRRFVGRPTPRLGMRKWYSLPVMLFLTATLILPVRGGIDTSPLNLSMVYFSEHPFSNHAASNYLWHLGKTIDNRNLYSNPCVYMSDEEAEAIFLQHRSDVRLDSVPQLIHATGSEPVNVLMIILESFSNKIVGCLGGMDGIAPNLDKLCREGVVFSNFYSTGNRSDRGISALLAAYPSLLNTSVVRFLDKSNNLTLLPHYFADRDYHTVFYYGGDIEFYNLKAFVVQGRFSRYLSKDDFPASLGRMSKWGVPDGYLFDRALDDLQLAETPFFKVIYTLSSHTPYDVPFSKIDGDSNEAKYLNSVAYTDSCLGAFIDEFRATPLWDNTLVVITSDHGTMEPGSTPIHDPATYRIPLVFTGGVIREHAVFDQIGMQSDLLPTLIRQLGWPVEEHLFANDLFSSADYAFYMMDSGWGFVSPAGMYFYDQARKEFDVFQGNGRPEEQLSFAKAWVQYLHHDFLAR